MKKKIDQKECYRQQIISKLPHERSRSISTTNRNVRVYQIPLILPKLLLPTPGTLLLIPAPLLSSYVRTTPLIRLPRPPSITTLLWRIRRALLRIRRLRVPSRTIWVVWCRGRCGTGLQPKGIKNTILNTARNR